MRRAVSLVPSATDIVVALGAADSLVGISADCDQPDASAPRPVVTRPLIDPAMATHDPAGLDAAVHGRMATGGPLYSLDVEQVVALSPDVVFAQDNCAVCALPSSEVTAALAKLGVQCQVVSLDPGNLDDVLATFSTVGRALGLAAAGTALEASCRARLAAVAPLPAVSAQPRVAVLDWVEPPYIAGNWVPDVVRAAGGEPVLASAGARSRATTLEELAGSEPDLIVVAPCGLDLPAAEAAGRRFCEMAGGRDGVRRARIVAFDGRIWFSRPGPHLVEGAEALAAWLVGATPSRRVGTRAITEANDEQGR
ncbi:MAG TPA: ABC transporter substrate-binding protein [Acidimicrobiales bacterium]|nr:ABC transporter substrate-binding protein [Acidimicrobiales bacterium]